MNYYSYQVKTEEGLREILLALFSVHPFDTFEENEEGFIAYIPEKDKTEALEEAIISLQEKFSFSYEPTFIPYKNWNAEWEANFQPILVDDFCGIRASFHDPLAVTHEIIINPEMAFGTGHHETTFMMVQMMRGLDFSDKKILDYGTGTGILAFLAERLGASAIDAVDIEEPAYHNTVQNAAINHCTKVNAIHGILTDVPSGEYEIILANINRNVILDSLAALNEKLPNKGLLMISGFLLQDEDLLLEHLAKNKFEAVKTLHKGKWVCMLVEKH